MRMESPVRICLGAALVVNLLLLGTKVNGNVLPQTTPETVNIRTTRQDKENTTWDSSKPNTPDVSLNELNPKESVSEEHTDKNAKYKDRGRVRYLSQLKSGTESPLRTVKNSTEAARLIIVTPTPEVKKPVEIIDSMRTYKKTKMSVRSSSTTPTSVGKEEQSIEEYSNDDDEEEKEEFEKFTSSKFHENFFTVPSFDDDKDSFSNKIKQDYSSPSYGFSNFFPKESSFSYSESINNNNFNSASFFDFDSDLTTPKNDFFDKKYQAISGSIIKNLESIKAKSPPLNITNVQKIVKENVGLERLTNNTPSNKSTVFIKNTKEIRLSDNEGAAGSANKALSDVHGTSIYYEMSVLSTETYAINHSNDYDCDNDTLPADPTVSTSSEEELASVKATKPTIIEISTRPPFPDPTVDNIPNVMPLSSEIPISSSTLPISTQQNIISSTEITTKTITRNRNYSKRLNLSAIKDSPNSVTLKPVISSYSPYTRKFYHTTPRNRPVWMAPKRNVTKLTFTRNTPPTTIYSEHFNIKDKIMNTFKPKLPAKAILTTVSSEIDPVLQSEISGTKKVVHTQLMSDNSIPSLWKRGSTKYTTSTATSAEVSNVNEMEIPPTSIAWALATLKSPSPIPSSVNVSSSTQKNIDENELQEVGEVLDKAVESAITSTPKTISIPVSEDVLIPEMDQNKIHWQPTTAQVSTTSIVDEATPTETKSEKLAAESNISVQSTAEIQTTTTIKNKPKIFKPAWLPTTDDSQQIAHSETIPPVDGTRSTGFESITKLSSDVTTPRDENIESFETNKTITEGKPTMDYEVTTIRFSYVPTEPADFTEVNNNNKESGTESSWHPIIPTRTKFTKTEEIPITTYRPKYITTTEIIEETTVTLDTKPPVMEVSSQILENTTDTITESTDTVELTTVTKPTTKVPTTEPTTNLDMTTEVTTEESTQPTTVQVTTPLMTITTFETTTSIDTTTPVLPITTPTVGIPIPTTKMPTTTTPEETTTIVVEVVTEINTEREKRITSTEKSVTENETDNEVTTDCSSEENDNSNEVISQNIVPSSSSTSTTTTMVPTTKKAMSTTEKQKVISTTERLITTTEKIEDATQIGTTERVINTEIVSKGTTIPEIETKIPETTQKPTTQRSEETKQTTNEEEETSSTIVDCSTETDTMTKAVNNLEDLTDYPGDMTTEASSRVLTEESGTGAAVAITVSTIGVIALVLLIGLLLVVRRRGRRGIYAQRCTPVSLDAYSLDSVSVGHRKGNHRLRASKRSYGNPAYDDEVTSHPMQYPALANFAMDVDSMTAEFAEIPSVSVRPEEVPPGCEDKNRYSNVLPLPETRVPLTRLDNDPTTEYINANYITGPGNIRNYYIACQAPLCNTVVDFWRMIWEQNSRLIVMLTEYMENGVEKCYEYLPPSEITDNKRMFGDFKVILKKREQRDKYAISSIKLINLSTRTWREVTHLWYFWPAKGVPDDYDSIIDFLSEMRSYMKISQTAKEYDDEGVEVIYGDQNRSSYGNLAKLRSDDLSSGNGVNVYSPAKAEEIMRRNANNGTLGRMKAASEIEGVRPCVVTCSSGAGRSAVLIALDITARALAAGCADVPRAVRHLRAQRPHSLSNRHHYILLYKVLSEYGNKLMGGGIDTI